MKPIDLVWLQTGSGKSMGVTWGVPWEKGIQHLNSEFIAVGTTGVSYPVQTWPMAYWPDGSLKWSAHAAVLNAGEHGFQLKEGHAKIIQKIGVSNLKDGAIKIDTGKLSCYFSCGSESAIDCLIYDGITVCSGARLEAVLEKREKTLYGIKTETFYCPGVIDSLKILQKGPIRCCVELRGTHCVPMESRRWLPFILRFYLYAGENKIRIQHTFFYDGNPELDFLKGIGMEFNVPLNGELYNRHVGLCGDTGFFFEPVQLLQSFRPKIDRNLYRNQLKGNKLDLQSTEYAETAHAAMEIPSWGDYELTQDSAEHYRIQKRTKSGCCYVHALDGKRACGLAFAGGEQGGLAAGIPDFWEKYPRTLELSGMNSQKATLKTWLYSPYAESMDLRHYDTRTYPQTCYEGAREMRSTPYGIANTNEIFLWGFEKTPDRGTLDDCRKVIRSQPLLACQPKYYHRTGVFGVWSLPDRRNKEKAAMEDQIDLLIQFYQDEIDRRGWYGFWNYGDVMHTYDSDRHCWKYDMGGYAWDNTELMPDLALWYEFLRTGRQNVFHMASAMTRHASEVDTYHFGPYQGLGSRHNVLHWGCGCKEARISMAAHNRFLYYLTADDRLGEILNETTDADFSTVMLDPMRAYFSKDQFPTHARIGPDWASFCSNWMTAWERFRDTRYRDKIMAGVKSLKAMPFHMISGPTCGYDPKSGRLYFFKESAGEHLMICQGEPEVWMELAPLLNDPDFQKMLAEYGRFYMFPPEKKVEKTGLSVKGKGWDFPMFAASMAAYASKYYHDKVLAGKVWDLLRKSDAARFRVEIIPVGAYAYQIPEIRNLSTNEAAQWIMNVIQCLELIGNYLS